MAITRTIVKPVQGQSPIVLHDVPQSISIEEAIKGDNGDNSVWEDTLKIKDFEAKIEVKDEYSTGVPYKKVYYKETLQDDGTWKADDEDTVLSDGGRPISLHYEGHERDFEVKVDKENSKVYIRYRWGMNDSHDLSVEKDITITERPTPSEGEGGGDTSIGVGYDEKLGMGIRQFINENLEVDYLLRFSGDYEEGITIHNVITGEWEEVNYILYKDENDGYTYLPEKAYDKVKVDGEEIEVERVSTSPGSYKVYLKEGATDKICKALGFTKKQEYVYFYPEKSIYDSSVIEVYLEENYAYVSDCVYIDGELVDLTSAPVVDTEINEYLTFEWNDEEGYNVAGNLFGYTIAEYLNTIAIMEDIDCEEDHSEDESYVTFYIDKKWVDSWSRGVSFNKIETCRGETFAESCIIENKGDKYLVTYGLDTGRTQSTIYIDDAPYWWNVSTSRIGSECVEMTSITLDDSLKGTAELTRDEVSLVATYYLVENPPYHEGYEPSGIGISMGEARAYESIDLGEGQIVFVPTFVFETQMEVHIPNFNGWGVVFSLSEDAFEGLTKVHPMFVEDIEDEDNAFYFNDNGERINAMCFTVSSQGLVYENDCGTFYKIDPIDIPRFVPVNDYLGNAVARSLESELIEVVLPNGIEKYFGDDWNEDLREYFEADTYYAVDVNDGDINPDGKTFYWDFGD